MENFINNLEKKAQDFTTLEKEVIKFIKSDPNVVNNITLTQFADLIFVSSATISRTLKKLGFEGFSEFKYRLNEVLSNGSQNCK
ncbi:MurR/RpiR family transcriptional regulator [Aerococcaceae bacterium DSM 111176]|nr:MurR/RpiR family transcriptional regulator [Aerococcaceae bacterium DSM 111176]